MSRSQRRIHVHITKNGFTKEYQEHNEVLKEFNTSITEFKEKTGQDRRRIIQLLYDFGYPSTASYLKGL